MSSGAEMPGMLQRSAEAPLVSVLMLAFNHEKFIRQAVASVMMQEAGFPYELVIGDDCSTDGTRPVLLELNELHPDRIRLFLHERNIGAHRNFELALEACRGRYVAMLEGDDYWTSVTKLQEQVNVLEQYKDCAICCHAAKVVYEDGWKDGLPLRLPIKKPAPVTHLNDLLRRGNYLCTPTVMFRSGLFARLPDWHYDIFTGDWTLWLLLVRHGNIRYLDKVMAVSRRHPGGRWSTANKIDKLKLKSAAAGVFLNRLNLPRHQRNILNRSKWNTDCRIAVLLWHKGDHGEARIRLLELLKTRPWAILKPDVLCYSMFIMLGEKAAMPVYKLALAINRRLGWFGVSCRRDDVKNQEVANERRSQ